MGDEVQDIGEQYGDDILEEMTTSEEEYSPYEQEAEENEQGTDEAEASDSAPADDEAGYAPPAFTVPLLPVAQGGLFTQEEREYYNELSMTDPAAAAEFRYQREQAANVATFQRMMQAQAIHGTALQRSEQKLGEWIAVHGDTIRQTLVSADPQNAGTPMQRAAALIAPLFFQVQQGADPDDALLHMARMITRQGQKQGNAPAPSVQSPSKVAPTGSRTGGSVGVGRPSNDVQEMMQLTGMNRMEAEAVLRGMAETNTSQRRGGGYR